MAAQERERTHSTNAVGWVGLAALAVAAAVAVTAPMATVGVAVVVTAAIAVRRREAIGQFVRRETRNFRPTLSRARDV